MQEGERNMKEFEYNRQIGPGDRLKWYRVKSMPITVDIEATSEDEALDIFDGKVVTGHIELELSAGELPTIDESGRA